MRALLFVVLLAGCEKKPPGWLAALRESPRVEAAWGYHDLSRQDWSRFLVLAGPTTLDAAQLGQLRARLAGPDTAFAFVAKKCIYHADARLYAADYEVELCFGCGDVFFFGPGGKTGSASIDDREGWRAMLTGWLGERPGEPPPAPY